MDWRLYLLSINGLCFPVLILLLFWRESPRWLIQRRRHSEACKELNAISAFNGFSTRFVKENLDSIALTTNETEEFVKFNNHFKITIININIFCK